MIVIDAKNVCKRYRLSSGSGGLRSALALAPHALMRRSARRGSSPDEFSALDSISFQVSQGEALGIVGHNGAGKTTILKLLSGITQPTSGTLSVKGKIAALVEL